jgi:hypothetical protein
MLENEHTDPKVRRFLTRGEENGAGGNANG